MTIIDRLNGLEDARGKRTNDDHDRHPVVGQCCNSASRDVYGDCRRCGRRKDGHVMGEKELGSFLRNFPHSFRAIAELIKQSDMILMFCDECHGTGTRDNPITGEIAKCPACGPMRDCLSALKGEEPSDG